MENNNNLNFAKAVKAEPEKQPLLQQPKPMVVFDRSSFPQLEEQRQRPKSITPVSEFVLKTRETIREH